MNRTTTLISTLILSLTLLSPVGAQAAKKKEDKKAAEVVYHLDTAASKITWTATKKVGSHTGTVGIKEGEFKMKNGLVSSGKVVINLNDIKNTDLDNPEYNKKLVDHLKSPDFFDSAKNPTAEFKIISYSEVHNIVAGKPNADVKGELTMHGVTKPANLLMFVDDTKDGFKAKGKLVVDRTVYGLKYNSKKFFDPKALGDKLINDNFDVDFEFTAKK